jgi:hypothetical protein
MRLLALGLIALTVATLSGRVDVDGLLSRAREAIAGTSPAQSTSADPTSVSAIQSVIQQANLAQRRAFSLSDPTVMRATATDSYYQELLRINRELASSGVTSIELVDIEWGDVTIDGATARATAYETWRSSWTDGSSVERTDRNDYTLVRPGAAWRISANVQPDARAIAPVPGTAPSGVQPGSPATVSSLSSNWSGYAATGGTFTSVTGSWIVPTVAPTSAGADATWVGIGGLSSRDLIQAGTQATVSGSGSVHYQAWIEMLPASSQPVPLSVTAGDAVSVTIAQKGATEWLIAMKNDTTSDTYSITVQYSSSNSSAEWVQEAPSTARGQVPLDQFGTLQFTGGSAVRDGRSLSLAALGARAITMVNGAGQAVAEPSTLGSDGSSFTVTRTDAPSSDGGRRRRP